ncbi:MAG: aspartate--tRNA ligase [Candidatus Omnitrophica bacterium]|nr:aspartate--tRNA ligase [Candidatus Omnitrophota bacterium]
MLRTHTCGQLNNDNINQEVSLCGWVASRRDHGKLIFIDIRDRYGITQVIFLPKPNQETYEKAKKLRNEDSVKIIGKVGLRPKNTENPNIPTGLIEVCAEQLEIIGKAQDLPFELDGTAEIGEETRLRYRYLDLRREEVRKKLELRHKFNQEFRSFLNKEDFLEIETPFLNKSTPEGARDYLVPSRLQQGKFYALPQSPQLFKQILMVGGIDKYYQIARCFRDEDLRKDRQPEFTQLDMELSFIEEDDIFSLVERMFAEVFSKALGVEIKTPFKRITHREAAEKYKSDKPDVGEGDYRFVWVVDFPLFELNQEDKSWQMSHHPFTSPNTEDMKFLDGDLSKVRARAYDLVLNGQELGSGSIRIHCPELQQKIFSILGISKEDAESKFGFLLRSFKYGVPVHGGIAFGLDRLYAIISGSESIREVIAFPKTQKGICPLTEAPSQVSKKQLKELNIECLKEE